MSLDGTTEPGPSPGGGGGSAIYKDGTPMSIQLGSSESVTVPTGETWVVTISTSTANSSGGEFEINNTLAAYLDSVGAEVFDAVLESGDTLTSGTSNARAHISGWVLS